MSIAEDENDTAPPRTPAHPVLWIMVAVMIGFEVMFAAVEAGLAPESLGRWPVYLQLAFFDLVFEYARSGNGVEPQVVWSLLTHAFLHGGWLHLALNGAAFLGLGHALVQAIGIERFLAIFAVTACAGALTFGLIANTNGPMVGASGAIFGMFAVLTAWQERMLRLTGLSRASIWKRIGGLVAFNAALAFGLGGLLAWEAHLGGWIAGWLMAMVIRPAHGTLRTY
ncbi:MAG TPA: rhomboid family intramembrane serine protease [Thermohalobaculum sp.]|nr:rhomboid family intramembrane serine protease [Thermohalobaculum sp.]